MQPSDRGGRAHHANDSQHNSPSGGGSLRTESLNRSDSFCPSRTEGNTGQRQADAEPAKDIAVARVKSQCAFLAFREQRNFRGLEARAINILRTAEINLVQ